MGSTRQRYVGTSVKGPTEILDHTEDWADVLVPLEDRIVDVVHSVTVANSSSVDMVLAGSQFTDYDTTMWLESGTAGVDYAASHEIVTEKGRRLRRTVRVRCVKR